MVSAIKLVAPQVRIFHAGAPPEDRKSTRRRGQDAARRQPAARGGHRSGGDVPEDHAARGRSPGHPRRPGGVRRREPRGAARAVAARSGAVDREPDHARAQRGGEAGAAHRERHAGEQRRGLDLRHRQSVREGADVLGARRDRRPRDRRALPLHRARDQAAGAAGHDRHLRRVRLPQRRAHRWRQAGAEEGRDPAHREESVHGAQGVGADLAIKIFSR